MEPDFYMRDPRALTKSRLANLNPCDYGRVSMLIDMSCEEYPMGVLEIGLDALCTRWRMNAARTSRLLLKMQREWGLIGRIEGKDGPLRIELSLGALRRQADGMDGRGHHDPITQVNALSEEALFPPAKSQAEAEAAADRQAWKRYREANPQRVYSAADRAQFIEQRRSERQRAAFSSPSSPLQSLPIKWGESPNVTLQNEDVTPAENSHVTPSSEAPVTPALTSFFDDVTSRSSQETETTTEQNERENQNNNQSVTPASHAAESVTSAGVTLPVTLEADVNADEKAVVVSLLSDVSKPYALTPAKAEELVQKYGLERCRQQVAWLRYRKHDPQKGTASGMLLKAIEEDWTEPDPVRQQREQEATQAQKRQADESKRAQVNARVQQEEQEKTALDALYLELSETERAEVDARARAALSNYWRPKLDAAEADAKSGASPGMAATLAFGELTRVRRKILQQRTAPHGADPTKEAT